VRALPVRPDRLGAGESRRAYSDPLRAVRNTYPTRARAGVIEALVDRTGEESSMTAHLLVIYPDPRDAEAFDRAYREGPLSYAAPRLKGATGVVTKRVVGPSFSPPPWHLISEVSFPTLEALQVCAQSSGGQEALAHATSISSGGAPALAVVVDQD